MGLEKQVQPAETSSHNLQGSLVHALTGESSTQKEAGRHNVMADCV